MVIRLSSFHSPTLTAKRPETNKVIQVEYGDPRAPWFFTLDALVSYYNVYVHLHEVDGECVADIFPPSEMHRSSKSFQSAPLVFH